MIVLHNSPNSKADILIRVPQIMYQNFFDMAMVEPNKEWTKQQILSQLKEWVAEKYSGYGIAAFQDYSIVEAHEVAKKTGYPIIWGMWLLLQPGADIVPVDMEQKLLSEPMKQIE